MAHPDDIDGWKVVSNIVKYVNLKMILSNLYRCY
jgi:hypothetical protein